MSFIKNVANKSIEICVFNSLQADVFLTEVLVCTLKLQICITLEMIKLQKRAGLRRNYLA